MFLIHFWRTVIQRLLKYISIGNFKRVIKAMCGEEAYAVFWLKNKVIPDYNNPNFLSNYLYINKTVINTSKRSNWD